MDRRAFIGMVGASILPPTVEAQQADRVEAHRRPAAGPQRPLCGT